MPVEVAVNCAQAPLQVKFRVGGATLHTGITVLPVTVTTVVVIQETALPEGVVYVAEPL